MKKWLAIIIVICLGVVALTACGGDDGYTPPVRGDDGIMSVSMISHNAIIEGNPYRIRYEADIIEAVHASQAHGFNVSYASAVSNWDSAVEAQQITNSINQGYDIILVNPVAPTGMDPLIERAQDVGMLWINADCIYESPDVDILNVGTDQYYLGYRTATYAGEVLGPGARVVMMAAMEGVSANRDRQFGFERGIQEQGLEVVATGNHDWNPMEATRIMTEILNSGVEFDGVLISQCAEDALAAFDATGTPLPKFMGFNDTGLWMQRMFDINADGRVMDFMVLSNPPGVGATALNFGLNLLLGRDLRDDIFDDPTIKSILIMPRISFTYDDMEQYRDLAFGMAPGDAITFWLTIDEVAREYFR